METRKVRKRTKRSFSDAWLSDDRFKTWIRRVSFDESLFHCTRCNKNFSCCSLSHIIRHAKSASHIRNVEKDPSLCDDDNVSKRKPPHKKIFKQRWLEIEQFQPWLREVRDDASSFFCAICDKIISGGLSQIYRHAQSKVHKDKFEKCNIQMIDSTTELKMQIDESLLRFEAQRKSAEIRYAALIADKNIPHETAKMILNFFQGIGENPNVLRSMSMGRTKCTNIISNVLCPVETTRVVGNLRTTKFSVFIDEISDISNEKWAFHVRYVNPETLEVHSQLVKLIDVDTEDASAEKLFNAFKNEMHKLEIPFTNIIALSCNHASVMTGKHLRFKKKLKEMCKSVLTLSCPCHSAALAAHTACAKLPESCKKFVEGFVQYIKSSPKRTSIFREFSECFQETNYKSLKLYHTGWISHYTYIKKLLESWDTIKHFLSEVVRNENTKAGENLMLLMQNVTTKAYLLFLKHVLHFFHIFNEFFQVVDTRIHLLQPKAIDFLTEICENFLTSTVLKELPSVTFSKVENHKLLTDICLGTKCEEYLRQLMKDGHAKEIATVRQNCLQFYVTVAEEVCKNLPVNNVFLSKLKIFLPHIALMNSDRETSYNDLFLIAKTIGGFDEKCLKREWFTLNLDFTVTEKKNFLELTFDDMWTQILQRRYSTNEIKYPNLKCLLNSIRSLPNSNADPERIMFFLTDIKTRKRNKLSPAAVNAICVLKSALKSRGETVLNMKINSKHLSLMSSDKLYANVPKKRKSSHLQQCAADDDADDDADDIVVGPSSSNDV